MIVKNKKLRFILLVLLVLLATNFHVYSQRLNIPVSVKSGHYDAKEMIGNIHNMNELHFSYSDNILDNKVIQIDDDFSSSLEDLLNIYFKPIGIGYKVVGEQVVLFEQDKPIEWLTISGYIIDASNSENIIGAAIFIKELGIGTISNPYGFFSLKVPSGKYTILVSSLGYINRNVGINLVHNFSSNILLMPKTYNVSEVIVPGEQSSIFLESTLMNMVKIDIKSLQDIPGLLGENDALRNLTVLPGIQSNELSTSSINVRGGGTDQTMFQMDEATLYSASHFGGFFSVFNPDVVNNVNVYKSDIPVGKEGGLSSLIDIHLREGDNQKWKTKGGIGLLSGRALVEGPIKKDTSSVLVAFRRSFVDNLSTLVNVANDLKDARFYFYDANFKLNYKLNKNNRLYISGYAGRDVFRQYTRISNLNYLGTLRWNHLFGPRFFSNTTLAVSQNLMTQGTQVNNDLLYWKSEVNDLKFKSDITYYQSGSFKLRMGYVGKILNIYPYSLLTRTEKTLLTRYESTLDRMMLNSVYLSENCLINNKFGIDAGLKLTHLLTYPFTDSLVGVSDFYIQPQLRLSYAFNNHSTIKASYSRQVQPLHQLPLSFIGVAVNRWMSTSKSFLPQISDNYTLGYYNSQILGINFSTEAYYRKMNNLVETLQDSRIVNTDDPKKFLHKAKGEVLGIELLWSYSTPKAEFMFSYDYCKAMWNTSNLNLGRSYEASHTRKQNLNMSGVYHFNQRTAFSATWSIASGAPYTAANGKYEIQGRTYLQFDDASVNTKKLPPYHHLDLSLDIAPKKNEIRKWKAFWNFSIYNVYFRKNALGVVYFIPSTEDGMEVQKLNPGYFYLYRFVPSISYRFEF